MSVKWKMAIHIVVTLIIGIVIGALLNRALVQKRIKDILNMRATGLLAPNAERVLKSMSPEQQKAIREILDKHAQRLSDIHQRFGREIQSAFKSLQDETDPLLTPEQKKQLEEMLPRPRRFRAPGPGGFPFTKRPRSPEFELEALKSELNLSEDQTEKIKAVLEEFSAQEKSLMEKEMSPENFNSLRQANEKRYQEIEKILTEDQKEKFREFRNRRFGRPED